ncbi:MAG TPA: hypothetical protein VJU15_03630 [Gemmatimonadales bacterium]|nr:hypothetical protein [Gemmatimonadales bacterium]
MRTLLLTLSLLGVTTALRGQATAPPPPPAKPEDVSSIDGIMKAVYDVISGPAGQKRDWNRMRSLFLPGARLIPTGRGQDGKGGARVWTLEEYISNAGPRLEESGFFERELGRVQEQYGNIVHLMSAYDSKRKADDAQPFARGVNSFQLFNDGSRWWVVTIFWQGETPDTPIPVKFLNK